jgi:hypothetical protein
VRIHGRARDVPHNAECPAGASYRRDARLIAGFPLSDRITAAILPCDADWPATNCAALPVYRNGSLEARRAF